MASAAERLAMALGAAAVVRLTTGWIAARRKTTTRVVLVGEEEEQLQNQAEPESDSDTEPQLHVLWRRSSR